jgi:hypothetical protein
VQGDDRVRASHRLAQVDRLPHYIAALGALGDRRCRIALQQPIAAHNSVCFGGGFHCRVDADAGFISANTN